MLSSVWHAILDNFRPITIWAVQLALYSWTDGVHGERWGDGSYLQLIGLGVMLLGTAIYNGTVTFPGLPAKDLLATADDRASPSLSRSPLITKNQSPTAVPFVGTTSPCAHAAREATANRPREKPSASSARLDRRLTCFPLSVLPPLLQVRQAVSTRAHREAGGQRPLT